MKYNIFLKDTSNDLNLNFTFIRLTFLEVAAGNTKIPKRTNVS